MDNILDEVLRQYDAARDDVFDKGIMQVRKDGLYGYISKKTGEEIVPCKFESSTDASSYWHIMKREMGLQPYEKFTTTEQTATDQRKIVLAAKRKELEGQGHINRFSVFAERMVNGTALVKLPNGQIGMAASVLVYDIERLSCLEVLDQNGEFLMFIEEPELSKGKGTPRLCVYSDEENLYVGSSGNEFSYLAAYTMGDFEIKWKTPMNGSMIESIAVNETQVIAYDRKDGKIKYFDKTTGEHMEGKDIDIMNLQGGLAKHLHSAKNIFIDAVPGLASGIRLGMQEFNNELIAFDNERSEQMVSTSFSDVAVDAENGRAFLAKDNIIGIFNSTGYIGMIPQATSQIRKLDFDSQTGCLMVSMIAGTRRGIIEILDSEAIRIMAETSSRLLRGDVSTEKLGKETRDVQAETPYIDATMERINGTKSIDEQIQQ